MAETKQNDAPVAEKVKAEKPKVEQQSNCLSCGKPIKKLKRYYRDGKFYCSKKCWHAMREKAKQEQKTQ